MFRDAKDSPVGIGVDDDPVGRGERRVKVEAKLGFEFRESFTWAASHVRRPLG